MYDLQFLSTLIRNEHQLTGNVWNHMQTLEKVPTSPVRSYTEHEQLKHSVVVHLPSLQFHLFITVFQ